MPGDTIKSLILPAALIFIMFGIGMGLAPGGFRRVFISPKAKLVGLFCQLVCLPLLAFAIATGLRLPDELAVGLMPIAACPGGPTSDIITHLSRGDTALSVSLTAVSNLITVFTIPLIIGASIRYFPGETATPALPFWKTFIQLLVVTILPVLLGMWANAARPELCRRFASPLHRISLVFLVLAIAMAREQDLANRLIMFASGGAMILRYGRRPSSSPR